jgi:hypothetical protein
MSQKNLSQSVAQKFQNFLWKFGEFFLKETGIAQKKKGCFVSVICFGRNSTVCNQKRRPWQQQVQRFFGGKNGSLSPHTEEKRNLKSPYLENIGCSMLP